MTDIYSKAVLTVIAVALGVIAWNQMFSPARAASDCGSAEYDPCYVYVANVVEVKTYSPAPAPEAVEAVEIMTHECGNFPLQKHLESEWHTCMHEFSRSVTESIDFGRELGGFRSK